MQLSISVLSACHFSIPKKGLYDKNNLLKQLSNWRFYAFFLDFLGIPPNFLLLPCVKQNVAKERNDMCATGLSLSTKV